MTVNNSPAAGSSLSPPMASFSCQGNQNNIKRQRNEPRPFLNHQEVCFSKKVTLCIVFKRVVQVEALLFGPIYHHSVTQNTVNTFLNAVCFTFQAGSHHHQYRVARS